MGAFQNLLGREVLSPPCRLQFPNIAEPDVGGQFSDGKYKGFFLFDKEETEFDAMQEVAEELCMQAFGVTLREIEQIPFKNGDLKNWQGFANTIYVIAKSKNPPDCWSPTADPSTGQLYKIDPKKLYAGCICRAVFVPFAYMSGSNRGITFLLNFVQFLEDAPRFGGLGQVDARDILSQWENKGRAASPQQPLNKAPAAAPDDEGDSEPDDPREAAPAATQEAPAAAKKGPGRPKAAPKVEAEPEAETPSARARREGAERRAEDAKNGTGPAAAKKSGPADLPVAKKPEVSKSAGSLMDMM